MKSDIKLSFLLYKGPYGYFVGRHFFGNVLQMTPAFETKEQAMAYKNENDLNSFWAEIVKFPKTYDSFSFEGVDDAIPAEQIKNELGMKEVVVGIGYNNTSFTQVATQTLEGLKSLAQFVGIPIDKMGLNGTLSIRAGITQGKASGTSAFIKDENFIRLTLAKNKGATLARAWFDALNYYLGSLAWQKEFLPNLIDANHEDAHMKDVLGTSLYKSYQDLLEYLYFNTTCTMVERTQKCYPRGYCIYATPENILTRCLEEYVKSNTTIKDNILCTRKNERDFSATDPILRYESRTEFYRYPYPTSSEKTNIFPLVKSLLKNVADFFTK